MCVCVCVCVCVYAGMTLPSCVHTIPRTTIAYVPKYVVKGIHVSLDIVRLVILSPSINCGKSPHWQMLKVVIIRKNYFEGVNKSKT